MTWQQIYMHTLQFRTGQDEQTARPRLRRHAINTYNRGAHATNQDSIIPTCTNIQTSKPEQHAYPPILEASVTVQIVGGGGWEQMGTK